MHTATVSSTYQVVIPRAIRKRCDLKPGQKVVFIPYQRSLRLVIVPSIEQAYGFLPGLDTAVERDEEDRV